MIRRSKRAVLFGLLRLSSEAARALVNNYCIRDVVCVGENRGPENKTVDFIAENKQDFPITITLELTEQINMASNVSLPVTEVLYPRQQKVLARLDVIDSTQRWNWNYKWDWRPGQRGAWAWDYIYPMPYEKGKSFLVTRTFFDSQSHTYPNEHCVDWEMPEGTPLHATRDGIVGDQYLEFNEHGGLDYAKKANYIWIVHEDGTGSVYLHLKPNGSNVKIGQQVKVGDLIGWSGNTGFTTGPHVHYCVYTTDTGSTSHTVPIKFKAKGYPSFIPESNRSYESIR